jgi:hypothetical protein
MASFGRLVSASPAKELGAAGGLGFDGFDRQARRTRGPAVGSMAPMGLGRREARLFQGDVHGDTFQSER